MSLPRTHTTRVGRLFCPRRLTLRSHPREQLCGRRTLLCVVRLVADAPRGELAVAILNQVGVLSTEKRLPLESIITVEVTRLGVTSYCTGTLLVRSCGERGCARGGKTPESEEHAGKWPRCLDRTRRWVSSLGPEQIRTRNSLAAECLHFCI